MTKSKHQIRWSPMEKLQLAAAIIGLVLGALWLSFPSSYFVRSVSLVYSEETRIWHFTREIRSTPFMTETTDQTGYSGRWWSEIVLIDGEEKECHSGAKRNAFYQQKPGNTVTYRLDDWALECLDAGPPFYIVTYRQVMLGGWLPLRPSRSYSEIEGVRGISGEETSAE